MEQQRPSFQPFRRQRRTTMPMTTRTKRLLWGRIFQITFAIGSFVSITIGMRWLGWWGSSEGIYSYNTWYMAAGLWGCGITAGISTFGIVSLRHPDKLHWSVMFALDCISFLTMLSALASSLLQAENFGWSKISYWAANTTLEIITTLLTITLAISSVVRRLSIQVIPDDTDLPPSLSKDLERESWYPVDELTHQTALHHQQFPPAPQSHMSFAPAGSHYAPSVHGHYASSIRSAPGGPRFGPAASEREYQSLDRAAMNRSPVPTRALSEVGTARPWSLMSGTLTHAPSVTSAAPSYWKA